MKKLLFALFLGLYVANLSAQDRLQPVESIYNADSQDLEYSQVLNKTIQPENEWGRFDYEFRFKYLVMPSFDPEYFLGLTEIDNVYYLIYRAPEESVWGKIGEAQRNGVNVDSVSVKVQEVRREISLESAKHIQGLVYRAVRNARFPDPFPEEKIRIKEGGKKQLAISVTMGMDGTNYYFTAKDVVGDKTATIWSPDKGTKMEELVSVFEEVIDRVRHTNGPIEFDPAFQKKIKKLTSKLGKKKSVNTIF